MCDWLQDAIDFWFPTPVEVDMDGVEEGQASVALRQPPHDEPLPEPPDFYKAEPAVLEANRIVQGKRHRAITDGRVVR